MRGRPRTHQDFNPRLEVDPELSVGPLLVPARPQVLLDISTSPQITVGGLEGHFAVHEHVGPGEVDFVTDMALGVPNLGEDIYVLPPAIPVVSGVCEVQVRVPHFDVVILTGP